MQKKRDDRVVLVIKLVCIDKCVAWLVFRRQ